jgi:hypothetical protein
MTPVAVALATNRDPICLTVAIGPATAVSAAAARSWLQASRTQRVSRGNRISPQFPFQRPSNFNNLTAGSPVEAARLSLRKHTRGTRNDSQASLGSRVEVTFDLP